VVLILFDTNIFIDLLNGCKQAGIELASYEDPAISVMTLMELRAGEIPRPNDKAVLDALLETFTVLPLDEEVTLEGIKVRGNSLVKPPKIKMPDAIIGATAECWGIPIVTRNPKDFQMLTVAVHIPYDWDSKTGVVSNIRPTLGSMAAPRRLLGMVRIK
jgi:predicted nucleic acid-binding protein